MNLSLLILLPLLTAVAIIPLKGAKPVRVISLISSSLQLILAFALLYFYWNERSAGNTAAMLFESNYTWYAPLHINYHVGVDGISVAMILLTAFVVLAGILVSWNVEKLNREFFFLLLFLSVGAYGYFISLDLFTLFFFLEISVIPKFLLIGIWGSGKKEYSAMKLALMLMAGSAFVLVGLLGLYFNTDTGNGSHTFDLVLISQMHIAVDVQNLFFPFLFVGFGIFSALFS